MTKIFPMILIGFNLVAECAEMATESEESK